MIKEYFIGHLTNGFASTLFCHIFCVFMGCIYNKLQDINGTYCIPKIHMTKISSLKICTLQIGIIQFGTLVIVKENKIKITQIHEQLLIIWFAVYITSYFT